MASLHSVYPLRFDPIFQYRMWGGRRLGRFSREPLPGGEPIGEAWVLSDRDDYASQAANGPLAGKTLKELFKEFPEEMLGTQAREFQRFPLLLKFLDAREMLSVQVHPSDELKNLLPPGERGKTEAWLVLESEPKSSIYAGLKPGATAAGMREKLANGTVEEDLASFSPKPGDGVFIPAGTVHALGGGVVVFEVQQNSDVTFRLYDWNRVDAKTGKSRELHIEQAIESTNFSQGAVGPVTPVVGAGDAGEELFACEFFTTNRLQGTAPFTVGIDGGLRVIVCVEGEGQLERGGENYGVATGDVWMLPAAVGACRFVPSGAATLLEIAVPPKRA